MIKLDFLILSVGRVATQAIWRYTDSHPDVFLPSFYDTDDLIKNNKYKELEDLYLKAGEHQKKGIIIHSPESLKGIDFFKFDKLIHMVRNPFDMVKALYNHFVHRAYIFPDIVTHPGSLENFVTDNLNKLKFFEMGKPFYENAFEKICIEFFQMGNDEIDFTMESLFKFLDLKKMVSPELFYINQQDDTSALMRGLITPQIAHSNGLLNIYMAYEGDDIFNETFYLKVFTIESPDETFGVLGYPDPSSFQSRKINVYLSYKELDFVSQKEKEYIDDNLMAVFENTFLDWCKIVNDIEKLVKPQKVKKLTKNQEYFLAKHLKNDLDSLVKEFPKLVTIWGVIDAGSYLIPEYDLEDFLSEKNVGEVIELIECLHLESEHKSLKYLTIIEKEELGSPELMESIGLLYLKLGKTVEAMENFVKGSVLSPSAPSFNVHIARVYEMEGDYLKSIEYLLKADGLSNGNLKGIKKVIGDLYVEYGNIDLAEEFYLQELDKFGFDSLIMENLKDIYFTKGNEVKFAKVEELCQINQS